MKIIAGLFGFLLLTGAFLFYAMKHERDDSAAIREYVESRGNAPIPRSWKRKIGDGI